MAVGGTLRCGLMTLKDTTNTRVCARCGAPPAGARAPGPAAPVVLAAMPPRRLRGTQSRRRRRSRGAGRRARACRREAARQADSRRGDKDRAGKSAGVAGCARRLTRRAHEGAFDRWGGHECDRNNIAAVRFTNAVATYTRARVYEERRRLQRSYWKRIYAAPRPAGPRRPRLVADRARPLRASLSARRCRPARRLTPRRHHGDGRWRSRSI